MLAELAFDIIDQITEIVQPRTCEGCRFSENGQCLLWSAWCMNSIYRPYWELLQQLEVK